MTVLERSELEASPLADLHAIADQLGLDGFRRLRKADLIDAILTHEGADAGEAGAPEPEEPRGRRGAAARRRRDGSRPTAPTTAFMTTSIRSYGARWRGIGPQTSTRC